MRIQKTTTRRDPCWRKSLFLMKIDELGEDETLRFTVISKKMQQGISGKWKNRGSVVRGRLSGGLVASSCWCRLSYGRVFLGYVGLTLRWRLRNRHNFDTIKLIWDISWCNGRADEFLDSWDYAISS
jgi:hypothetical protein